MKAVSITTLCLALFGAAFLGINSITLASATEGTEVIKPTLAAAVITPVTNEAPVIASENQKPEMELDVIFISDITPSPIPSKNALSPEAAADLGAQYILDVFGESIDGKTVHMDYHNHPSSTRATWSGRVLETSEALDGWAQDDFDWMQFNKAILFTFSLDAVTGERIDILTLSHWVEVSDEVRAALDELSSLSQGRATTDMIELRSGGAPPTQLDEYIEAARELAQRHFIATEVVSIEFRNINVLAYELDESGNLFATSRQLIFEVTDSTGRIADMAIVETTKQLIWLNTGMNDTVPGWNYVGEEPGLG